MKNTMLILTARQTCRLGNAPRGDTEATDVLGGNVLTQPVFEGPETQLLYFVLFIVALLHKTLQNDVVVFSYSSGIEVLKVKVHF